MGIDKVDLIVHATGYHVSLPLYEESKLVKFRNKKSKYTGKIDRYPDLIQGIVSPNFQNCYVFGIGQPRGGIGSLTIPASQTFIRLMWIQAQMKTPAGKLLKKLGKGELETYFMDPVAIFNEILRLLAMYQYLPWVAKNIFRFS